MHYNVKRLTQMLPKLSDEQVKKILTAVSEENEMLDSILASISTGLVVVDRDWKLLRSNKLAERYLGFVNYSDESKIESLKLWEFISEPEIAEFLEEVSKKGKTNISEEFTTNDSSGNVRFITVAVLSLVHESKYAGNIIKINDITEKRKDEVRLRRMENMAGLTNLAAGMAHEIKNPLGAISIHIQLIQKALKKARDAEGLLPEKRFLEDHLDVVNEEIDSLNKIVMDFLFAVRPVNAKLVLADPSRVIENIVSFFKPEFNKSNVDFIFDGPEKSPRLLFDEKLLREAIINLVQNSFQAIKEKISACEDSEKKSFNSGKICIKTSVEYDKYIINISDNGSGMSEETVSRIFEPYFTTKANGTGLGMTMVYKIIKEFQGEISVESEKGVGTEFNIVLPVPQTDTKLIK